MLNLVLEAARGIFEGLIDTPAAAVVFPAVVGAANAAVFDKAVVKRHAAMRATLRNQSILAARLTVEHQILAENAHALLGFFLAQFRRGCHRVPVAPQELRSEEHTSE